MQTVSGTITTLSGRLSSSTLLEDRRAAILGLRSFAKEYPASVASDALRGLIGSLSKDGEDVDTVKVVLETLLMLFNPNENSPEASEEIELWLADEFTQRQDNITLLLDFLDTNDFYSRLYSLQLLSAILAARTERTEECIFTAPLGISRLVTVLDDKRDAVRNAALSLLTYLTPNSSELQKLVAFENAFDRIFTIIKFEGGLLQGDRVVEDCLILLANLLRLNISNQSFFRETGCVPKLSQLLQEVLSGQNGDEDVAAWVKVQQNRNIYALIAVIRLFLVTGGVGTQANQASFWQNGILKYVLELAFSRSTLLQIKAEALITCADIIRGYPSLQEQFAQLQVTSVLDDPLQEVNGNSHNKEISRVYVIDGLLDLTLSVSNLAAFDSRLAACECIKAYFYNHSAIRKHFLHRAIDGHNSGADETGNVLTTILQLPDGMISGDPYRYWFAAAISFHLTFEDEEARNIAMTVVEGDASSGEEVVTCIQTLTANLLLGIEKDADERVLIGYLMILSGWLFEAPDAVNDFLGEGSNVQSLVQAILRPSQDGTIIQGLCSVLLGIIYEFSTKDSPIPRTTLHSILASQLGRDQYIDRLNKLRSHQLIRDFEVLPQKLSSVPPGSLPDVFFDQAFVDFLKDNFSRLIRAIDREPGMEIPIISNGVQKGISRELVDTLRLQLEEKGKALQSAEDRVISLERQLGQEQADNRRVKETGALEISRIKTVNEALQRHHEEDTHQLRLENTQQVEGLQRQLESLKKATQAETDRVQKAAQAEIDRVKNLAQVENDKIQRTTQAEADRIRQRIDAEIADLKNSLSKSQADLEKVNKNHVQDLQTAHDEYTLTLNDQKARLARAEEKVSEFEARSLVAEGKVSKAEKALADKEAERDTAQSELDDLLMVFGDLEEKVARYRDRLRAAGENVSDGDDDEDDEDEEESEAEVD